jgi:hypothetical protein
MSASAAAPKKTDSNVVRPFENVKITTGLGLLAQATLRAMPKQQAAAATDNAADEVVDVDEMYSKMEVDARKQGSSRVNTLYVVMMTPTTVKAQPRTLADGKKFPGFCKFLALVLGAPGAEHNRLALASAGNTLEPHCRLAQLECSTLNVEDTQQDDGTTKKKYTQERSVEKLQLTEGMMLEITMSGEQAYPTHTEEGADIPEKERKNKRSFMPEDVMQVSLYDLVQRRGYVQALAKNRVQLKGNAAGEFANDVLHAIAESMQRMFTPLIVDINYPWDKVVVTKKVTDKAGGGEAADEAAADPKAGGGGARQRFASDGPTNEKVQQVGAAGMLPPSREAMYAKYVVGNVGTPEDTKVWREAAGLIYLHNSSTAVFDPNNTAQWTKKQGEGQGDSAGGAAASKTDGPIAVQIRYSTLATQYEPLDQGTRYRLAANVTVNHTIPSAVLSRFGISDPDWQYMLAAVINHGVFATAGSPMTAGWTLAPPVDPETGVMTFSQSFYPMMSYAGKGQPIPSSAFFYVDHACTLLNTALPVTREFVVTLMQMMAKFVVNGKFARYAVSMNNIGARMDTAGKAIGPNYLSTRLDSYGNQVVVNLYESSADMGTQLEDYELYALSLLADKSNAFVQAAFANRGELAPAYISAALLQALATRFGLDYESVSAYLDITNDLLEKTIAMRAPAPVSAAKKNRSAAAAAAAAAVVAVKSLPPSFVRPVGAPTLAELLDPTSEQYIGNNALQLDNDVVSKSFSVLPWAIHRDHLAQRGFPALYAGHASQYDFAFGNRRLVQGLMPLEEMVEKRRAEIEALLSAGLSVEEEAAVMAAEKAAAEQAAAKLANGSAKNKRAVESKTAVLPAAKKPVPAAAATPRSAVAPPVVTPVAEPEAEAEAEVEAEAEEAEEQEEVEEAEAEAEAEEADPLTMAMVTEEAEAGEEVAGQQDEEEESEHTRRHRRHHHRQR